MKSLDTNILLYAADEDCREHEAAIRLVNQALDSPTEWMLADQVLFEMYAGLRHPRVFAKPLSAAVAKAPAAAAFGDVAGNAAIMGRNVDFVHLKSSGVKTDALCVAPVRSDGPGRYETPWIEVPIKRDVRR